MIRATEVDETAALDRIRWRTRAGAPWRDVPARYGEWETAYGLFRCWQRDGTWARGVRELQALRVRAGRQLATREGANQVRRKGQRLDIEADIELQPR
ncbi:transposase [Nonomuraea sp. NPDC000554]|uniref:transposase n=1 Tax=Nonomuraea sp. NPDC000554 TaxID=3154259 RepID=UPI003319F9F5